MYRALKSASSNIQYLLSRKNYTVWTGNSCQFFIQNSSRIWWMTYHAVFLNVLATFWINFCKKIILFTILTCNWKKLGIIKKYLFWLPGKYFNHIFYISCIFLANIPVTIFCIHSDQNLKTFIYSKTLNSNINIDICFICQKYA
jgi:hypothetical protein